MKKLAILFVLFVTAAVFAAAEHTVSAGTETGDPAIELNRNPVDVKKLVLADNAADAADTIDAAGMVYFGPYNLCDASGDPEYSSFAVVGQKVTGTTPTASFDYTIMAGPNWSDTTGLWTAADTLDGTGAYKNVDLSSSPGRFIAFRVNNYDGTETVIANYLWVLLKKAFSYTVNQ